LRDRAWEILERLGNVERLRNPSLTREQAEAEICFGALYGEAEVIEQDTERLKARARTPARN
jgi:hypothetical protein